MGAKKEKGESIDFDHGPARNGEELRKLRGVRG